jgi:hypothetical protein
MLVWTGDQPRPRNQPLAPGFVHVMERKFALPGNAWAKGKGETKLGLIG